MRVIRIAAALIQDRAGRLLLVRKTGTRWFMQPGGKIESGESALSALRRELIEEIGLEAPEVLPHLGRFSAPAANEPDCLVDADIFLLSAETFSEVGSEIEEAVWVEPMEAAAMPLAPLSRDHIIPLAIRCVGDQATQSARL